MLADARFWIGDTDKHDVVLVTPFGTFFLSCKRLLRIVERVRLKFNDINTLRITDDLYQILKVEFQQHIGSGVDDLMKVSGMWVEVVDGQRTMIIT